VPPTVLLLDDDTQFRSSVTPALEAFGLRVLNATKGSIARALLEEEEPSLLIVDGLLPDINGIVWIENLRGDGINIPIIFVSAFYRDLTTFKHLTHDLDVIKVFHKPIAVERFAREVANAVSAPMSLTPAANRPDEDLADRVLFPDESSEPGVDAEKAKQSYTSLLPIAADNLTGAIRRVHSDADRTSVVAEALRQAHDLHGAAQTHGFAEISEAVGRTRLVDHVRVDRRGSDARGGRSGSSGRHRVDGGSSALGDAGGDVLPAPPGSKRFRPDRAGARRRPGDDRLSALRLR